MEEARRSGETILTHDLDCGTLLAFGGESAPSVVVFRLRAASPERLLARLADVWVEVEAPLRSGALVVVEDAVLRVRVLPFGDQDA